MKNGIKKGISNLLAALAVMGMTIPFSAFAVDIDGLPDGGVTQAGDLFAAKRGPTTTYKVTLGTAATQPITAFLQPINNLGDIASASTARTNLGLGSSATFASTAFLQAANNLSDLTSASTARTNLGLGTASLLSASGVLQPSNNLSDVSSTSGALTNLLPSQTGQAGKFLGTNGTIQSWQTVSGAGTVTTTGTPALGNLTKFSGGAAITNGDLAGDCTTNGTLSVTCTKTNGVNFAASATTDATVASNITSGTLPAGRMPAPTAVSLGGVQSTIAVTHQFLTAVSTAGVISQAQPAATDISGLAASATTDTTNAANISSGTLSAARLPNPSATTLGGIQSTTGATHNFITSISTSGVPAFAQPAFTDISGSVAAAQLPNPTAATLGGVQSIAAVSHNFLTSISTSGVPAQAQPAFADISGNISTAQMNSGTSASSSTFWRGDGTWAAPVSVTASTNDIVVTPSPGTNTFTVGSTQLINAQGAAASYTILGTDMGKTVTHNKSTAVAVTLPQAGTTGFEAGKGYCEINIGAGTVTVTPTTSTINGGSSQPLTTGQGACFTSDGSNYTAFLGAASGGGGSGTVTSVSVTTANGVSGSVATSTTTPAITLTLGAITPTSVATSKTVIAGVSTITVSGAAFATDASLANHFRGTPAHSASTAMSAPSNPVDGQKITYELVQDSTGSGTISWNAVFDFGTAGNPTLTTTANKRDIVGFVYSSDATKWLYLGSQLGL